jgi:hypothetical protein
LDPAQEAAPLQFDPARLKVRKQHAEALRNHARRQVASIRYARGLAHFLLPRKGIIERNGTIAACSVP